MKFDLTRLSRIRALVIGDLMIDEYFWGRVERISPEAPVPVVTVERESHTLGGAGNVINNLKAVGARVSAVGTAGTGVAGKMIFEKLNDLAVETDGIVSEPERPTTRKTRVIASNQQVLRIDKEIKRNISDATLDRLTAIVQEKVETCDLIIISDYDKGLVTRDLVARTAAIAGERKIPVLADPKSLDFTKYAGVSLLTPNQKEAGLAAHIDIQSPEDLFTAGNKILDQAGLERLIITCGKDGMVLFEKDRDPYTIESKARQVFDVSGAGDTVISFLGLGLASGASFIESAMLANAAAGIVVGKVGTATASIEELDQALKASL
ncbi:D-glycero-beta-D-manno-heptose-7-phosphate kinase [Desulfospira joergensenii]|uniref:D-glycero-beta-D-manno-heptose-7-phosphate kinase n=1 Tax=Desulfospira joergensenii TaxID=53329 RepID=UPI0003B5D61C|nr:D-glycero-beta-D-manno-heptose-7-phosphate kinase [Desulfospira joergensenii]